MTETSTTVKGRGRPRFKPTDEQRKTVAVLVGNGIGQDLICQVIGCTPPTLRRAFKREIAGGHAYLRSLCATTIAKNLAAGGSVGQRAAEYLEATRFGISKYAPPPKPPKEPELGKKEKLNQAAQTGHENNSWGHLLN